MVAEEEIKETVRNLHEALALAEQATEGWLKERIVNSVVGRMEEGLRE